MSLPKRSKKISLSTRSGKKINQENGEMSYTRISEKS